MAAPTQVQLSQPQIEAILTIVSDERNLVHAVALEGTSFGGIVAVHHPNGTTLIASDGKVMEEAKQR